jgi:hypothetical protein
VRGLSALVLLGCALPLEARAGVVGIDLGATHQAVKVEPGKTAVQPFAVGRFQVRLVVDEAAEGRGFRFTVRLERYQGEHVEVLASEQLRTGAGVDVTTAVDTKLGPLTIHCRG